MSLKTSDITVRRSSNCATFAFKLLDAFRPILLLRN